MKSERLPPYPIFGRTQRCSLLPDMLEKVNSRVGAWTSRVVPRLTVLTDHGLSLDTHAVWFIANADAAYPFHT